MQIDILVNCLNPIQDREGTSTSFFPVTSRSTQNLSIFSFNTFAAQSLNTQENFIELEDKIYVSFS